MPIGFVSKGEKGEVKLEYDLSGKKVYKLWEKMSGSILETTFDHEGGVLDQRMLNPDRSTEELLSNVAKSHSLELKGSQFT
ncbi:MAG: hypothetical protein KGH66_03800, partial [Candidatus Micrarchaeota archaeon]|nr:hypothetical protein [Candidatus Micrarchaeota archaeon]